MEKSTREEALRQAEMLDKIRKMPDSDIDMVYAAGRMDDLILGAIQATLSGLGYAQDKINEALYECEHGTFDRFTASELRKVRD